MDLLGAALGECDAGRWETTGTADESLRKECLPLRYPFTFPAARSAD